MTPKKFRQIALSLPETSEQGHENHPDFRVQGKVFASLCPGEQWGIVKVSSELQSELLAAAPDAFEACNGAWGRNGATIVILEHAEDGIVARALTAAWEKQAPSSLSH